MWICFLKIHYITLYITIAICKSHNVMEDCVDVLQILKATLSLSSISCDGYITSLQPSTLFWQLNPSFITTNGSYKFVQRRIYYGCLWQYLVKIKTYYNACFKKLNVIVYLNHCTMFCSHIIWKSCLHLIVTENYSPHNSLCSCPIKRHRKKSIYML